jgi:hypothetical protein
MERIGSGILYTLGEVEEDADGVRAEVIRHTYLRPPVRRPVDFTGLILSVEGGRLVLSDGTHPMRKGELTTAERDAFLDEVACRWNSFAPETP